MKSFRSLLVASLLATPAFAQTPPDVPEQLDLKTALSFALENNYSIRQAKERIREQEGLIIEIKAQALPTASVDSRATRTDWELYDDRGGTSAASNEDWSIALNVRQLLYAGGGVKSALDAQQLVREAALLDLQAAINDALLAVRTRFYNVLLARDQIRVQEQNVGLLREQLQTAKNRFEAGSVSNFDVLRAEVELANAQPPLIRARNNFRISVEELRQVIGYDNSEAENLRKVPEFIGSLDFTPTTFELQQALDAARTSRPELKQLEKIADARVAGVRNAKSNYYPDLALVGGYEFRKDARSPRFRDSLDGWTVGLQSSWAVFDGRATAGRVRQARSQLEQAKLSVAEQRLAIEVEVRRALSSLQEAMELADAAQKVVEQAEEALRLANARYSAGTATQLDVLSAQVALTQARDNQLQANYSYNVAVATMRTAIGQSDPFVTP